MILKKSAVSRRWTAALLAAAAAAGPQQEDELWWLTGGSGEHSQADPAAKKPVQLSAPGGDEEAPADPEGPGEAYDGPSTVHNEEGFFVKQEDETGHGTWNSLTEKGLWVGGDGDDTGFRVDNDGNVATTGNADIDGTLSASNDKFTVDEKGNLHAKNENARIDLDEAGAYLQSNTTYMGVTDGAATIASGASRVQVTEDGAVFETPDGKTSIKGNAVETGKVTAEKGDIGGVWMADRNVSNVDKISAAGGQFIVDEAGKVTASKGDIGGVWMADRNVSNVDKITAEKGDIGDVWMADGKLSADFIQNKNGSFMADGDGNIKMNDATATGDLKVNGDASVDGTLDAGFIKNTDGSFMADGDGNVKMNDATAAGDLDVAGTLTAGGGKFAVHDDGLVDTKTGIVVNDGNFAVHSDGLIETRNGINAANGNFLVYDTGLIQTASGINAANGNFRVYDTGDTEVKGNVEAETFSTAGGAFKVGNDGSVTAEGQLSVGDNNAFHVNENGSFTAADGKFEVDEDGNLTIDGAFKADGPSTIGGVTLNEGRIAAAGGKFYVDDNGGVRAEGQSAVGGVHLNEGRISAADGDFRVDDGGALKAAGGAFTVDENGNVNIGGKVTADRGVIGDVTLNDGKVTADRGVIGDVTLNDGKVTADRGVIGDVTLNDGKVTAQDGDFSGSVTAETGTIGGVMMTGGGIIAANDNFVVNGETGAFRAAGNKFHVYGSGDVTADGKIGTVNGNFHVDENGSITAAGAGTIGGVSLSNGAVAAQDVTITLATNGREAETVSMSDMWDAMSGGTMTVDGISYGGSYFYTSGTNTPRLSIGGSYFYTSGTNTPRLSIGGGRYNVNMNHFGQIMDAVEGVGVDTVTDAIDGLKQDGASSGTAGTAAAANEAVTETASANGAEAAPAAKEARAKLAAASFALAPDVTPSLLSEETKGSGQTGTDADPDREPNGYSEEGGSGTEGGNAGQTLDLPNDHGSLGGLTITGNRPDENGNSFAVTGKSQFDGDSQFNGDVAIGNSDTDYSLKLNGEDVATENYVDHQITNAIGNRFDELGSEIDSVGAISAALAGLHPLDYDGTGSKFQLSAAVGSYDGTQAAAVGGFYHFNEDVMMSVGGATAFEGDHKTAANIGVTFRVGQGSSGKRLSSDAVMAQLEEMNRKIQAMDEKINSLEQKNQDLEAENKELKAEA